MPFAPPPAAPPSHVITLTLATNNSYTPHYRYLKVSDANAETDIDPKTPVITIVWKLDPKTLPGCQFDLVPWVGTKKSYLEWTLNAPLPRDFYGLTLVSGTMLNIGDHNPDPSYSGHWNYRLAARCQTHTYTTQLVPSYAIHPLPPPDPIIINKDK